MLFQLVWNIYLFKYIIVIFLVTTWHQSSNPCELQGEIFHKFSPLSNYWLYLKSRLVAPLFYPTSYSGWLIHEYSWLQQVWKRFPFDLALVWTSMAFKQPWSGLCVCGQTMPTVYLHFENPVMLHVVPYLFAVWSLIINHSVAFSSTCSDYPLFPFALLKPKLCCLFTFFLC